MKRSRLSTIDNPYSPFDDFIGWYNYDENSGYHSSAFLDRIAKVSDEMSDADHELAIEQAIDEIVKENVLGIYIKVEKDFPD